MAPTRDKSQEVTHSQAPNQKIIDKHGQDPENLACRQA